MKEEESLQIPLIKNTWNIFKLSNFSHPNEGGHTHDDAGIDHRPLHLPDEGVVLLHEAGEPHQDGIEDAARLARRHHVHIEIGEGVGVLGERVGHGVARLDVEHHLVAPQERHSSISISRSSKGSLFQFHRLKSSASLLMHLRP